MAHTPEKRLSRVEFLLGPLLLASLFHDFPLCLSPKSVKCDLLADDGTLNIANDNIDNIHRDLQQSLNDASDWCCTNLMALIPAKTKCMLIATRQKYRKEKLALNLSFVHANETGFRA